MATSESGREPARAGDGGTAAGASVVGTWRLVSFEDWDASGKRATRFGEHPRGYFVYDATGHLSVHIMRTPPVPAFGFGRGERPTVERKAGAYDAYFAYFGTYTLDARRSIVTHHVEGALDPSFTDTDQPRPFHLAGDTLVIGDGTTWKRVLVRVRAETSSPDQR